MSRPGVSPKSSPKSALRASDFDLGLPDLRPAGYSRRGLASNCSASDQRAKAPVSEFFLSPRTGQRRYASLGYDIVD
jgi:hypothetical protein